ncbi:MAG TPA: metallophosphoesterase [Thermoplasmata archaeon]|nr:metallophosphoesterase [Thermoplasmata archaeon]
MNKKLVATLAVVAMVVVGSAFAAYWLGVFPSSSSVDIVGGIVANQSDDYLTIWCYQPELELTLDGYEGTVRIRNCVAGSEVTGAQGAVFDDNTTISIPPSDERRTIMVSPPQKEEFVFAVMGDSQGHNDVLESILQRLDGCDFAIICGDLTPTGRPSEFVPFQEALNSSRIPVYTAIGNHDVKTDGADEYISRLGPTEYSFTYNGITFAVADSSDLNITAGQIEWMRDAFVDAERKVVVTHAPCYDPFDDNHTLFPESCERMLDFAESDDIDAVFTGHIHAFNYTVIDDTDFVITGGAGANLVDGVHHFVNVTVDNSGGMSYEKCDVMANATLQPFVTLTGADGGALNVTYEGLFTMDIHSGFSSFENYFGNIGGEGDYSGVSIAYLVDLIGGMQEGDTVRVTASDGYSQDFGYLNIYPDAAWLDLQGLIVLAMHFDDESVPAWEDGPKLVMIPSDGLYSNSDCEATSYDDQGYSIYPSAGARWIKNVASVQVIPCP